MTSVRPQQRAGGIGEQAAIGIAAPRAAPPPLPAPRLAVGPRALLRVPLLGKLIGVNVLVALVATAALALLHQQRQDQSLFIPAVIALAISVAVGTALMNLALAPLAQLQRALHRVSRGELGIRVQPSRMADRDLLNVGDTVNTLLDELVLERARIRQLARDTIRSADEERSRIARGLHDSTAQTLAALSLEARLALQAGGSTELTQQLELIKDLAIDALEEVRDLSHTIHPRVLDDLGLAAALGWLARCTRESSGVRASLRLTGDASHVPLDLACTLYRIAEAALQDAAQPGRARTAELHLGASAESIDLEVTTDGPAAEHEPARLHALRERLALASGTLTVHDDGAGGTRVHAFVPLGVEIN